MDFPSDNNYTVVQCYEDTMEPYRKLYTGRTFDECKQVIRDLMNRDRRWSLDNLSIIDHTTGRHMSIMLR